MVEKIEVIALHEKARESYLNYALSVITSRALPDVRDGMKPVQRRILYAMYTNLKLIHTAKPRKSALVVGEVMGKYHPHGDQAIYDAMVRMAQPFSLRYPLVEGQGNFGSLDGDAAAAMRYTEVRLESMASELIAEIGKQTVDFQTNYDGQHEEPVVLPAQLPNLLLNGATGIAVGMATNIPPHNLREVVRACVALIERPESSVADLMRHIKGPDFPTGGVIQSSEAELAEIYETGQGSVKICGEWTVETLDKRKRALVIKSVPFTVNKATLVEKIAEHITQSNVPQLRDVRDESTDEVRIVCELAPEASAEAAAAYLMKHTPLLMKFHVNLTCLAPTENPLVRVPARLNLKEMLRYFLDFRLEVVTRRLAYELERLRRRIFLLEGFAKIFDALDEAIALIRGSEGRADAQRLLMARFALEEEQAEAVLETRLYRLAKLEIQAIREELAALRAEASRLEGLLGDEEARWRLIREELQGLDKHYGDKRRSTLGSAEEPKDFSARDYIVDEETFVIVTRDGWVKRQRSYQGLEKIRVREGDALGWVLPATTRQTVIFFTDRGKAYTALVDKVPATAGYGDAIQTHFDFSDGERVVGVICADPRCLPAVASAEVAGVCAEDPAGPWLVALTRCGNAVRMALQPFMEPSTVAGRTYVRLADEGEDGVLRAFPCGGGEEVCLATYLGRVLVFQASEINVFKGAARGVSAIRLEEGDSVLDFALARSGEGGLEIETSFGRREVVRASKFGLGGRNKKGRALLKRGHLVVVPPPVVEFRPQEERPAGREGGGGEGGGEGGGGEGDGEGGGRSAEILHQLSLLAEGRPVFVPGEGPGPGSQAEG